MLLAAYDVIDTLSSYPFHNTLSNVFRKSDASTPTSDGTVHHDPTSGRNDSAIFSASTTSNGNL